MPESQREDRVDFSATPESGKAAPPLINAIAEAITLHRQGALALAKARYEEILAVCPNHVDALHLLGVIANQTGSFVRAIELIEKAILIDPTQGTFFASHGNALQNLGRLQDALTSNDAAIALKPDHVPAHFSKGNALLALGDLNRAVASYDQVISLCPGHAAAYHNRGTALHRLERYEEAVASYDRAIALKPDYAEAHFSRGIALGDWLQPDAALASHDRAIALRHDYPEAHFGRGNALLALRRPDAAIASYATAIALRPSPNAHNNSGAAHLTLGQFEAAIASFERAIALEPNDPKTWYNRGNACLDARRYEDAVESYDCALTCGLDQAFLRCASLHARMHICDWREFDRHLGTLQADIEHDTRCLPPFPVVALIDSLSLQLRVATKWMNAKHPGAVVPAFPSHTPHPRRIRVGYYSADFHDHATSQLTVSLFENHDRKIFELFAFSFGPNTLDEMRRRVARAFDQFIDVRFSSDGEVAAHSRRLGIDIAVDLKGFTTGARPGIFAERCAPIQVNFLGYPATMGAACMDYMIADRIIVPEDSRRHYSEKLAYLPNCYQPNDPGRRIAATTGGRNEHALPAEGFVFCCFNASYKITPTAFSIWMRILCSVKGSVLWLLSENPTAMANLRREAEVRGVDGNRLVFAPRTPLAEHLARHRHANLFLDTFPCNAHTTASDALWAGLPVLTCCGASFASRVAASLLRSVRLADLVTYTQKDYEALAIELATCGDKLKALKATLTDARLTSPLFDSARFARDIESAYLAMIKRHHAGLPPEHLHPDFLPDSAA